MAFEDVSPAQDLDPVRMANQIERLGDLRRDILGQFAAQAFFGQLPPRSVPKVGILLNDPLRMAHCQHMVTIIWAVEQEGPQTRAFLIAAPLKGAYRFVVRHPPVPPLPSPSQPAG